jgi:uncharacterized membrane protein
VQETQETKVKATTLTTRRIVISGVLAAITLVMGVTRIGFVPVPTPAGNATLMHIPAIIGGILEGWIVGGIIGLIFGIISFLQATVPMFKDPLVAIPPRIFIGITAYFSYVALRKASVAWMLLLSGLLLGLSASFSYEVGLTNPSLGLVVGGILLGVVAAFVYLAFQQRGETIALSVAAAVGTLTNTVLVLGMVSLRGYLPADAVVVVGVTHGVPEVIVAAMVVVAVVMALRRAETGSREAKM